MVHRITKQDKLAKRAPLGDLKSGRVSAALPVPVQIPRPEYMLRDRPEHVTVSDTKNPETVEEIRIAGQITADAIAGISKHIAPGVTTDALDRVVREFICDHGAYPSCLGYMRFPKSTCTSIDECIYHGIPDDRPLEEGDIISLDITAYKNGVHGDTCVMFPVGETDEESRLLHEHTKEVMLHAVKVYKPGRSINVIDRVIESYAARFEYGVVRDFTGYGVGEAFHSGLTIPHYDSPMYNTVMEENMMSTIEPMPVLGSIAWSQWPDDWTVVTKDRGRSVQYEYTIVVTESGGEILTLPSSQTS